MSNSRNASREAGERNSPVAGRLFFGIPLSEDVRIALAAHLSAALGGERLPGRVVPAPNWHITLRFLGDTPVDVHQRMVRDLAHADMGSAFSVRFDRLGAFPRPERARVLWLGICEGAQSLAALAAAVEGAAARAGLPPESRPFAAHLTLSRLNPEENVRPILERVPPFAMHMRVERIVLYRSHLGQGPVRYEGVNRFELPLAVPDSAGEAPVEPAD